MPRGRRPGFKMSDEHRLKIKNSNILNVLVEHAEGKRDLTSSQVAAGLGLLKKIMPDLSAAEINHTVKREASDYSRTELADIISNATNGSGGNAEEDGRSGPTDKVH